MPKRISPFILWLALSFFISLAKPDDNVKCDDLDGVRNDRINCTSSGEVSCFEGWTGDLCNKAICREGCHADHGYCTQPGECKCALGWRGKNCDECVPLPGCNHGFCSSTSYECICEPGWEGNYCSIPVCREGCHSSRGYCKFPNECRCRVGWGGETCVECKPLPGCANGYCIKPLECRCKKGWTGLHCNIPTCKENCSLQHGYCLNPGECRCEVGWWRENCDTCFPYPGCKHGTCEAPWECNCEEGWKGILCDERNATGESFCERNRGICLNGGTCVNVPDERNYTCVCPTLFTGDHCDYLAYSRASIFPIFSRGSSGSRTTLSTTGPPAVSLPFSVSLLALETTTSPETIEPSNSFSTSVSVQTSSQLMSFSKSSSKDNNTQSNETISSSNQQSLGDFSDSIKHSITFDENVSSESKLPEKQLSSEVNDNIFNFNNRERKYSDRESTIFKQSSSTDKARIFSDLFPIRRTGLFSDVSKNQSSLPKSLNSGNLAVQDFDEFIEFDNNPIDDSVVDTDANSPQANQIEVNNRYIHQEIISNDSSSEITNQEQQSSFFPPKEIRLVSQEKPPMPSNLRVSPFIFADFDALPQESSPNGKLIPEFSHLTPQTRINRRTGSPPSRLDFSGAASSNKLSRQVTKALETSVSHSPAQENQETTTTSTTKSYYEENYAGRVHIGDVTEVDKHAPLEEIVDAFIELKKLTSL